ncbi:MAG: T9SS type A sorting domain-containing protein [Bacteroidota bacterium]
MSAKIYFISFRKKMPSMFLSTLIIIFSNDAFSQRAFTLRTPSYNMQGDAVVIGNRVIVGSSANKDDDKCNINNIDLDGDATTVKNSSSANLTLPVGATIAWAGLYWGSRSASVTKIYMKFKIQGDAYSNITATQLDNGNTISGITTENHYQCFADVSTYVTAHGAGTYWGGDVQTTIGDGSADPAGTGYYGGWALIVIYSDATQPYRSITVRDGYSSVWGGNGTGTVTVPVSGFLTPSSGSFVTKIGIIAWEGDMNITNDKFRLNLNDDAHNVSDANNPSTNFFNGTITNTPRNPNTTQNWGVDFDYITSNISLPLNSSSTNIYFNTSGDFYLPGAVVFSIEINPVVLPVELLSFNATRKNNSALLEWTTGSEKDNDYFQIERSTNTLEWQTAGRMTGQGRSTSYQFYEFEDFVAAEFTNKNNFGDQLIYYRLKQVDYNGKFNYSYIKSVRFEKSEAFNIYIYPNPARENVSIKFTAACDSSLEVKMTDSDGRIIYNAKISQKDFGEFDLKHLKSGIYFIEAKDDISYVRKRVVVE